ncbi:class C sortase [Gardnerella vaginalis]|uniref:class C sortase n=1 Tax=Gardnerella vaginalis TaxID=2702 RepID=UPI0009441DB8|nr:class C sortase [Gardnerella vaginalis]AYZ22219.1 class C sortase [Gardnerella vaginalis]OKY55279.1 Sortase family protein [Gardnerella vaginalis]PNL26346.1 class C sortase [Gardnerella vaginalis]PTE03436.1 class C sortase [Gardnerella vaginalis]
MKLADISNWCRSLSERAVAKLFKNKAKRTSSVIGTSNVAGASDLIAEESQATEEQTPQSNSSKKINQNTLKTKKTTKKITKKKSTLMRILEPIALVLAGILCFSYPVCSTLWNNHVSKEISTAYDKYNHDQAGDVRRAHIRAAKRYNAMRKDMLTRDPYGGDGQEDITNTPGYKRYLKTLEEPMGIIGIVKIPKIGVKLPIYHGTKEDTLARGAGHLYGTDLPVGGKGRHTVITAHTGLPNATMFDSLTDLKKGDYFYLDVQGETLRYKVFRINVVDPHDISLLQREKGRDLATLLTCTPYGVNSHRLLVTGYRVLPDPVAPPEDHVQWPLWMTLFVIAMIFSAAILAMMITVVAGKRRRKWDIRGKHILWVGRGEIKLR